jgi:hypothetical protein
MIPQFILPLKLSENALQIQNNFRVNFRANALLALSA